MSEHRCFPKKRLSTHTVHFRHVTGGIRVSVTQPLSWNTGLPFGLFRLFNTKNAPKYQNFYLATQISQVIFAGALTIFAGALPPWAPPWLRGRNNSYRPIARRSDSSVYDMCVCVTCPTKRLRDANPTWPPNKTRNLSSSYTTVKTNVSQNIEKDSEIYARGIFCPSLIPSRISATSFSCFSR